MSINAEQRPASMSSTKKQTVEVPLDADSVSPLADAEERVQEQWEQEYRHEFPAAAAPVKPLR